MIRTVQRLSNSWWTRTGVGALAISIAAASTSVAVAAPPDSKYLLVGSTTSSTVGVLRLNADGSPTRIGTQPTGLGTQSLIVAQDGRTVFVSHGVNRAISRYRFDSEGRMTPLPGGQTPLDGSPITIIGTRDSRYVFAGIAGAPGHISTFAVGPTGELRRIHRNVLIEGLTALTMLTVDPDNRFLRVVSYLDNSVQTFRIGGDGSLTRVQRPVPTGRGPVNPGYTPDGRYFYVAHEQSGDVHSYRIGVNGALTPIGSNPFSGPVSHQAVVSADGKRMYVPNTFGGTVSGFNIRPGGRLAAMPGSPFPVPGGPMPILVVLHPNGRSLYAVDMVAAGGVAKVHQMAVRPDGTLHATGHSADAVSGMVDGPVAQIVG